MSEPDRLAFAGGGLWTANGGLQDSPLTSVTLGGVVTTWPAATVYRPDLAAAPSDANALYVAARGLSPGAVVRFDVSGAAPVQTKIANIDGSNIQHLAVSADGSRVVPAA